MPTRPSGCKWQLVVDFPLCGLKKCECEFLRAVVFMFEKLQLEIIINIFKEPFFVFFLRAGEICLGEWGAKNQLAPKFWWMFFFRI